ncbi:hypothetical protein EU805_03055 [Salipiger sp. IMCC34102]|uniref:nickel/cobalt transporter n=1 Tax=Salipiger sp. IMCC34102 TaxID=2510647 RepID=UPI00101C7DD8|nr:hypothetical protein [Salipiger sp. IMCC34102]RYH04362.1 hypothetical protein EU805_03055 [Salipiger sp. IMCC34102]
MRVLGILLLAALSLVALWLWGLGGAERIMLSAGEAQRSVQNAMAASLRALKAQEPGAILTLWSLCFGYGFVHAAGPGHGKLVIGGYGLAARATARRLAGLAVLSSLAQALTAIALVYAAVTLLGWGRAQMTSLADGLLAPVSAAMIATVGAWLILRGLRQIPGRRATRRDHGHAHDHHPGHDHRHHHHGHDHHHDHGHAHDHASDGICATCGHAHAPTPRQAAEVRSVRDALVLIGSIAVRPCTGAIFLLILTHALGLDWAGIAGALVMGLGTATFTAVVALAAAGVRESVLAQAVSSDGSARLFVGIQIAAGSLVLILAGQYLLRSL